MNFAIWIQRRAMATWGTQVRSSAHSSKEAVCMKTASYALRLGNEQLLTFSSFLFCALVLTSPVYLAMYWAPFPRTTVVRRGCDRIRSDLDRGAYASAAGNPSQLFRLMAQSCDVMGGTIGSLTMTFLEAAADSFQREAKYSRGPQWRAAVFDGTQALMQHGGAQVGDRTLVDALKPAADVLASSGGSLVEAARAARVGCESTKSMTTARYGRSRYVPATQLLNQADPGAYAIVIIFEALVEESHV